MATTPFNEALYARQETLTKWVTVAGVTILAVAASRLRGIGIVRRKTGFLKELDTVAEAHKATIVPRRKFLKKTYCDGRDIPYFRSLHTVYAALETRLDENVRVLAIGDRLHEGKPLKDDLPACCPPLAYLWKDFGGALRRADSLAFDVASAGVPAELFRSRYTPETLKSVERIESITDTDLLVGHMFARHCVIGLDDLQPHYSYPDWVERDKGAFMRKMEETIAEMDEDFDEEKRAAILKEAGEALEMEHALFEEHLAEKDNNLAEKERDIWDMEQAIRKRVFGKRA